MVSHESIGAIPSAAVTFDQIERELGAGMVPRIFRLLENQPVLLAHIWGEFRSVVLKGALPRVLKEMVGTVVATEMHCEYVRVVHLHSLTIQGTDKAILDAVRNGDYGAMPLSAAVRKTLRFALLATRTNASYALPENTSNGWERLRIQAGEALADTGFSAVEQAELVITVALFTQICTIANLLGLDPGDP